MFTDVLSNSLYSSIYAFEFPKKVFYQHEYVRIQRDIVSRMDNILSE